VKKDLAEHDYNALDEVLLRVLARGRARSMCGEMLTVYFGTPNMFITLLFGFYHGTNPPLGTLIIYLCMHLEVLCLCRKTWT
jgi:hypothetical protein